MSKDPKQCEHRSVTPQGKDWTCDICGLRFFPLIIEPGKITFREPYATLRDQFAMAAMQAVITHGTKFADADIGKVSYEMADVMMKAREQ